MQPGGDEIALVGFDDRQMNRNHCYKLGKELSWGKGGSGEKMVFRDSGLWFDNRTRALSFMVGAGQRQGEWSTGIWISMSERFCWQSDPVVKLKESLLRESLDQGKELVVVMGKAQAEGWGLGLGGITKKAGYRVTEDKGDSRSSIFQGLGTVN